MAKKLSQGAETHLLNNHIDFFPSFGKKHFDHFDRHDVMTIYQMILFANCSMSLQNNHFSCSYRLGCQAEVCFGFTMAIAYVKALTIDVHESSGVCCVRLCALTYLEGSCQAHCCWDFLTAASL